MPINPNIALGARPMEQPNMLAQMGQMMQLRQMQQGFESENALRDFYAKGGDLSTAEGKREIMSRAPAAGMKLIGQQSEISARDIGTAEKSLAMLKNQAGLVKTPQDAANWLSSFYKNPLTRPYVEAVAPMDQALAAIPTDPAALQGWLRNASLKADQIFESADAQLGARSRIQAAGISAAPGHRQADLAREKYNYELANPALERVDGENGFYLYNKRDPNSAVPLGMRPSAPPAATSAAPANGLFMTTQPAATNLNAFARGAPNQAGPTVANAAAAAAQPTTIRPKQPFRAPVAVMQDNQAVLVPADKAIGMQPATAFTEKQAYGKTETVRNLNTAIANLTDVIKPGGLLEKSTGSGIGRLYDSSAAFFGQATEGAKAAAALAPIADLVLKMVPRFEGPQSDKDTQSYKEAAGQLADSGLPNETRRDAAKVIIRLMTERREQFGMTDQTGGSNVVDFGSLK
jgi:hypothetical protein